MMITVKNPFRMTAATSKRLNDDEAHRLIAGVRRVELYECPRSYMKAVRATLIALGYDEYWVNSKFREMMGDMYVDSETGKSLDLGGRMMNVV